MTRVGWLADGASYVGGAELTQAEFRAAAPEGVEVVDCQPGDVKPDCDVYAIHNCVTYTVEDLQQTGRAPAFKYWNDIGSWLDPDVRKWLDRCAGQICISPIQQAYMGIDQAAQIPPPVDLKPFEEAAAGVNGDRRGLVSAGSWRNVGKAPHKALQWAQDQGEPIQFFGDGEWAPDGTQPVRYEDMPEVLAAFRTFVFLPNVIEPFGRTVVEAWAAGCELVINDLIGAKWWIEEDPDALETAAGRFWELVLR